MSVLPSPAASATDVGNAEDGTGSNAGTRRALGPPDATPVRTPGGRSRPAGILTTSDPTRAAEQRSSRSRSAHHGLVLDRGVRALHAAFRRRQTDTWLRPGPAAAWGGRSERPADRCSRDVVGAAATRNFPEPHSGSVAHGGKEVAEHLVAEGDGENPEQGLPGRERVQTVQRRAQALLARRRDRRCRSTPNADGGRDASGVLGPTSRVVDRRP